MNRLSGNIYRRCPSTQSLLVTKRWFDWDPRVGRKEGKPAITGTQSVYVSAMIPVVLVRDIPGLGSKGEIIQVKRGFARNVLVPEGSAIYGTLWENIDTFADPRLLKEQKLEDRYESSVKVVPLNWINNLRLEFLRETTIDQGKGGAGILTEPVTMSDILNSLSSIHNVDFLPSHLSLPTTGIDRVGLHEIPVHLTLANSTHTYSIRVDVKDKAEVVAAERREAELREAMKLKRPDFVLGSSRFNEDVVSTDQTDETTDYDGLDNEDTHNSDEES